MNPSNKPIVLIGYSGHAFVIHAIFDKMNREVVAYCDFQEKELHGRQLTYCGTETSEMARALYPDHEFFISIGSNAIRRRIYTDLISKNVVFANALHPSANIDIPVDDLSGVMVGPKVVIHPHCTLKEGVVCNTGSIIEHECKIGPFSHIAPGAVLCGNVTVGSDTLIGANAVVVQGITIGSGVTIGAGSVVVRDIPDGVKVLGNPGRFIPK